MFADRRSLRFTLFAVASILAFQAKTLYAQNGVQDAAAPQAASPAVMPVLLELFTSEGCSSCPPADELLSKLNGTVAPSGQQIIALSEHVTYWNPLGWTDPF